MPALALVPPVNSLRDRWRDVGGRFRRRKWLATGKITPVLASGEEWLRMDQDGQQNSALCEAVRGLRTLVLLSTPGRSPRSLLISSAELGEGKTTIAANLAISLAHVGKRTLLIDGDIRHPCVHKVFEIKDGSGLVNYLTNQQAWQTMVRPTGLPGLDVLVCGPKPPNPAELLSSERMRTLLREGMTNYDVVLLDSPPLLNVADSRILATLVEGVILVVKGGATPRELVQRAQSHARDVGANVIGVVLNNLDVHAGDCYYYHYHHYDYYGPRDETSEKT